MRISVPIEGVEPLRPKADSIFHLRARVAVDDVGEGGDDEAGEGDPHLAGGRLRRSLAGAGLVDVEEEKEDDGEGEAGEGDEVGDVAVQCKRETSKRETQNHKTFEVRGRGGLERQDYRWLGG